jgi:sugar O-acyltransferase (sialic acid O-acetyltransferase NeuD family)
VAPRQQWKNLVAISEYILIGGGEHARVVLDVLLSGGHKVNALFDPKYSGELFNVPQLGEYKPDAFPDVVAIVAIGNNSTRRKVVQSSKHAFGQAIHASAVVSRFSTLGEGTVVFHGAIVQANAVVGHHVIVNTGAQVDHDCMIGDYVHLAPSVTLCGTVQVGEGTLIGAGATVIPGIKIGKWAVVGAGAVVTTDVPDYAVVVGVPSKVIRINNPSQA